MTTGSGGMLVTEIPRLLVEREHLTTQARLPGLAYHHDEVGYNYRLSDVSAAIGVAQLEQLDGFLDAKRRIAGAYDDALRPSPDVFLPPSADWAVRSLGCTRSVLGMQTSQQGPGETRGRRDRSKASLAALHQIAPFLGASLLGDGSVAEQIGSTAISLPSSVQLTSSDQRRVIDTLVEALNAKFDDRNGPCPRPDTCAGRLKRRSPEEPAASAAASLSPMDGRGREGVSLHRPPGSVHRRRRDRELGARARSRRPLRRPETRPRMKPWPGCQRACPG